MPPVPNCIVFTPREEFNLDSLPVHGLTEQDPEVLVVSSDRREHDQTSGGCCTGSVRSATASPIPRPAVPPGERLRLESDTLDSEREALKRRHRETPKHIKVAELGENRTLDALPSKEKRFPDILRMIAYRAESRMMATVVAAQGRRPYTRQHLKTLFHSDIDIIPDHDRDILRVHILGTACNAADNAVAGPLKEFNKTRTRFPGIRFRLVYELPPNRV